MSEELDLLLNGFDATTMVDRPRRTSGAPKNYYTISLKRENKTTYKSLIRFLPFYQSPKQSILSKYVTFLNNRIRGESKYIDDSEFINKQRTILTDCFFGCRNSDLSNIEKLQTEFSASEQHTCLIQVIKDEQHPEYEGQIMVYQFGKIIFQKLENEIKPSNEYKEGSNPFSLLGAKLFQIDVTQITDSSGKKFPRYDNCEFLDKKVNIMIDGVDCKDKTKCIEFLKENTPVEDFLKCKFTPWDEQTTAWVGQAIKSIIPPGKLIKELEMKYPAIFSLTAVSEYKPEPTTHSVKDEDEVSEIKQKSKKAVKEKTKPEVKEAFDPDEEDATHNEDDDDFDFDFD